jgi:hypothetical protein
VESKQVWATDVNASRSRGGLEEPEVETETVVCPEMSFNRKVQERPTMRKKECELRRRVNPDCQKCTVDIETGETK